MKKYSFYLFLFYLISCSNNYYERELNDEYIGVIKKIYIDNNNHAVTMFDVECSNQVEINIIADYYPESKYFSEIGDSIIKKKGEPFFLIKKNNGNKEIKTFITKFKQKGL